MPQPLTEGFHKLIDSQKASGRPAVRASGTVGRPCHNKACPSYPHSHGPIFHDETRDLGEVPLIPGEDDEPGHPSGRRDAEILTAHAQPEFPQLLILVLT